jgi:hypothetical protein
MTIVEERRTVELHRSVLQQHSIPSNKNGILTFVHSDFVHGVKPAI